MACDDVEAPVCGCDGRTYRNECLAASRGISVDREGACIIEPVACQEAAQCAEGQFCRFEAGTCDVIDRSGQCAPTPRSCPDTVEPICGCDGVTYNNPCLAFQAGVSVAHRGACEEPGEVCRANADCGSRERFCEFEAGTCDVRERAGVCEVRPRICPDLRAPVCGCDNVTYGNDCERSAAGAALDHVGECGR